MQYWSFLHLMQEEGLWQKCIWRYGVYVTQAIVESWISHPLKSIAKSWESSQNITLKAGVQLHLLRVDVPTAFYLEIECKVCLGQEEERTSSLFCLTLSRGCLCAPGGSPDLNKKDCGWVGASGFLEGPLLADVSSHHLWRIAVPRRAAVIRFYLRQE